MRRGIVALGARIPSVLGGLLGEGVPAGRTAVTVRRAEKKKMPKSFKQHRKTNDLGIFGSSWEPLGGLVGHLGGFLEASRAVLSRRRGFLGGLGGILDPLGPFSF